MLKGRGTERSSEEPPKDKPNPRGAVGVSERFHLQGTSLRVPRPTNRLPETPDAPTLCSCSVQLPWTVGPSLGGGGRGPSKPGAGAAVGRAFRAWRPRPWLTPLLVPAGLGPGGGPAHWPALQERGLPQPTHGLLGQRLGLGGLVDGSLELPSGGPPPACCVRGLRTRVSVCLWDPVPASCVRLA